jgi:antitoxin YobK
VSWSDLTQALELIERSGGGSFAGPQPESRIACAEQLLGLVFPPTYREFLERLGCGSIFGEEFYGLVHADFEFSCVPNGVWVTLDERCTARLPRSLIVVGATGYGGLYAIDTSQKNEAGESPVVEWWLGSPPSQAIVAEDFGTFLWQSLKSASNE